MNNFTKSVMYSTTVLAVGLVAMFAIYSNISPNDGSSSIANISPAAGGASDLGVNFDDALSNSDYAFEEVMDEVKEIVQDEDTLKDNAKESAISMGDAMKKMMQQQ